MRSRFLFYIFLFLLSSLAIGCYDDEGNYDYKTINEVAVKLEETYGVRKVDTVFVIRPEIRQSLATDTTNLKFEWYYNSASDQFKGDLVSTADTVAIRIDPADKKFSYNHYLRFYIHDTQTGASYLFPVKLKVAKPYEGAWMVLQSKEGKTGEQDYGYIDISSVRSCYPEGKRMCECLCTAYASQYGLNVKSARLAQTFGPGILPTENRVFAQFARSAMNGQNIVLHTMGTSEGNYVYTRDAVKAIIMLLTEGSAGQSYNIANEKSHMTIRQMAELVVNEIADNKIQVVIDVPKDNSSLGYAPGVKMWLDASKIRALGWQPEVDLAESYRRMIKWMER